MQAFLSSAITSLRRRKRALSTAAGLSAISVDGGGQADRQQPAERRGYGPNLQASSGSSGIRLLRRPR